MLPAGSPQKLPRFVGGCRLRLAAGPAHPCSVELDRFFPVLVELGQSHLRLLEGLRRLLDLAALAIEVRRRQARFEIAQLHFLRGDLRLQLLDLAIWKSALP